MSFVVRLFLSDSAGNALQQISLPAFAQQLKRVAAAHDDKVRLLELVDGMKRTPGRVAHALAVLRPWQRDRCERYEDGVAHASCKSVDRRQVRGEISCG